MSLTIWKFPLAFTDRQTVSMPEGSRILTAQMQGNDLCLWALVNPTADSKESRFIEVVGTGNPISEANRLYISTAQMYKGALVWHIFEII